MLLSFEADLVGQCKFVWGSSKACSQANSCAHSMNLVFVSCACSERIERNILSVTGVSLLAVLNDKNLLLTERLATPASTSDCSAARKAEQ